MILLICGGRTYLDYAALTEALKLLPETPELVIQGGARGADALGKRWAKENVVHCAEVPALWDTLGRSAGYVRNAAMLRLRPCLCLALPGGKGTRDMAHQCSRVGIPVWRPYGE